MSDGQCEVYEFPSGRLVIRVGEYDSFLDWRMLDTEDNTIIVLPREYVLRWATRIM